MSSGLALYPKTGAAVYCATKAALHSFSQSLRYQLEKTPVRVVEVILPLVETPMTEGRGRGKISAAQAVDAMVTGLIADGMRFTSVARGLSRSRRDWLHPLSVAFSRMADRRPA